MSSKDTSEEKTLPASPKKLKDLRKKGQISRSNDMVAGAATTAACFFLALTEDRFSHNFRSAVDIVFDLQNTPFEFASSEAMKTLRVLLGSYLALLVTVVVSVVIVTNIVINRGFLFALDPIKFDLNKLNPVEGIQRIFSVRTAVELAKNVVKIALLFSLCLAALSGGLNAAFSIPFCGILCVGPVANQIARPMIIIAVTIFIFAGLIDVVLQRWLFMRDQRMTKTEAKRERKDEEGSPEVRTMQRRLRRRLLQQFSRYTEADATIFIEGILNSGRASLRSQRDAAAHHCVQGERRTGERNSLCGANAEDPDILRRRICYKAFTAGRCGFDFDRSIFRAVHQSHEGVGANLGQPEASSRPASRERSSELASDKLYENQ